MSAAVPTQIPEQLTAGDTATWKISLTDYPAGSGWVLSYVFRRLDSGQKVQITAGASGDDHLVNEPAATTANWNAGEYQGQAYVTKSPDRFKVWEGPLTILANFATADDVDPRSNARKILDSLEAAILKISQAQSSGKAGGIVEWTAEGLHIKRSSPETLLAELTKQRDRYAAIVSNERVRDRLKSGKASGRRILYGFAIPR
jgi:hypothetical protein